MYRNLNKDELTKLKELLPKGSYAIIATKANTSKDNVINVLSRMNYYNADIVKEGLNHLAVSANKMLALVAMSKNSTNTAESVPDKECQGYSS